MRGGSWEQEGPVDQPFLLCMVCLECPERFGERGSVSRGATGRALCLGGYEVGVYA